MKRVRISTRRLGMLIGTSFLFCAYSSDVWSPALTDSAKPTRLMLRLANTELGKR